MNNVGLPIEMFDECERRAREEGKTLVIVGVAID
jgi:hypothetical protein